MKKKRVNRGDSLRALLTETTPYELPLTVNNSGFYRQLKRADVVADLNNLLGVKPGNRTVALHYKITKDERSLRTLSCPHPAAQISICELYNSYDALILFLCNKSRFSLRYPSKTASYFYDKNGEFRSGRYRERTALAEVDDQKMAAEQDHASSYFAYKKYNLLYKFYESYEYQGLEKKYPHLLRFDISKCFDSIYTHTLAWAVKNKSYAKSNGGFSFENQFDKVISNSNHGETNGIIIGPEVCRIFAEIILQRIDREVSYKLKGVAVEGSYSIRRYVDDYFVFASHPDISRTIFSIFKSELERHKLHVNDSKTEEFNAPFITPISVAKSEIASRLGGILDALFQPVEGSSGIFLVNPIKGPHDLSNKLIKSIKEVLHSYQVGFHSVAGHALAIINKKMNGLLAVKVSADSEGAIFSIIFAMLEFSFFVSSMAPRVRSIYLTTKSCVLALNLCPELSYDKDNNIRKKIHDECLALMSKICRNQHYEKSNSVEFSNLLVCIGLIGERYRINQETLRTIVKEYLPKDPTESLGYFELISLLFYIRDDEQYDEYRAELGGFIKQKITSLDPSIYSESAHLLLDCISCPYLSFNFKAELISIAYEHKDISVSVSEQRRLIKNLSKDEWFCVWSGDDKIFELLEKKSLKSLY